MSTYEASKDKYSENTKDVNRQPTKMVQVNSFPNTFDDYSQAVAFFSTTGNNVNVSFTDAYGNVTPTISVPSGYVTPVMVSAINSCDGLAFRLDN